MDTDSTTVDLSIDACPVCRGVTLTDCAPGPDDRFVRLLDTTRHADPERPSECV